MIHARIRKSYPPGPDSTGFTLNIEFETSKGVTALFGPSGSGKTLTLDCIAGFVDQPHPKQKAVVHTVVSRQRRVDARPA